jgi:hypothetical protein
LKMSSRKSCLPSWGMGSPYSPPSVQLFRAQSSACCRVVVVAIRDQEHVTYIDLVGMGVRPALEDNVASVGEGEVIGVIAGSAEPVMLDVGLIIFAPDHSDHAAIAQITEFFVAVGVKAFVDHDFSDKSF